MIRFVLFLQLAFFSVMGGVVDDLYKQSQEKMEMRVVMATLLSHSLKELGEIRVNKI